MKRGILTTNEQVVLSVILRFKGAWTYKELLDQLEKNGTPKNPRGIARTVWNIEKKGGFNQ